MSEIHISNEDANLASVIATEPIAVLSEGAAAAQVSTAPAVSNPPKGHQGQTGPKTARGKSHSKWNALKHGRHAKSIVLPFEDEQVYKRHLAQIREALVPDNYVEEQIVEEYGNTIWKIHRQETRGAYEREKILNKLEPWMVAQMLCLPDDYCDAAPNYLLNLKLKIGKSEQHLAMVAYDQYESLMENAQGIANFNLVWRQFPQLFTSLGAWVEQRESMTSLWGPTGKDLSIAWQQNPKKILECLETLSKELYYLANFTRFKPKIRVYMESWYFAQRLELQRLERDDGGLIAERKHANALLDKLMQLRKTQYLQWAAVPKDLSLHGAKATQGI